MEYLKDLMKKFEESRKISDYWDKKYEADPENTEVEKEWDKAYTTYQHNFVELMKGIVRESNNEIDAKTARKMILTKRKGLKALIEKMA